VMQAVQEFARAGGLVVGICNGFQILCEAGLLPGVLMRNRSLRFVCKYVFVRVENRQTAFTGRCQVDEVLHIPVAHAEGLYYADGQTLGELKQNGQVLFRYCTAEGEIDKQANPNGSLENIAGIMNRAGNVMGMMPHPDRCAEGLLGSSDGVKIFGSMVDWCEKRARGQKATEQLVAGEEWPT
ncbi:MAG: phosphoribosylformylglycinamidine synthase I, partial [Calditrichaeota bacterium]